MENYLCAHALQPGAHDYAVIDRLRAPDLAKKWPLTELVLPMLRPQAELYPWLLRLKDLETGEWARFMAELKANHSAENFPVCSLLLKSDKTTYELSQLLARPLYFTNEKRQGHILRYYDARVFFHLCWMLSPWQLARTLPLQDISHWTFWLEGRWHTVTIPWPDKIASGPEDVKPLSSEKLKRCAIVNTVLEALPPCTDLLRRRDICRKLEGLLLHAEACQLTAPADRAAFARQGLTLPDNFWARPKMAAFIARARKAADCYRDETSQWSTLRWQEMLQD